MSTQPVRSILTPRHCPECGFSCEDVTPENAAEVVRSLGPEFEWALVASGRKPEDLRRRPTTSTWSTLEYAAHVRDVIAMWGSSLHLALIDDDAALPVPDADLADRTATERAYNEQDPASVSEGLSANAERMAKKVAGIEGSGWDRSILIGDTAMSSLDIVQKVAHEGHHHLQDIGRLLEIRPPA